MAVFAAYAEALPVGEDWDEERSRSAFAVRDGIRHALARQSERRNEQAPAIAITSRWLRSKARSEAQMWHSALVDVKAGIYEDSRMVFQKVFQ